MDHSIAEELYSDTLRLSNVELGPASTAKIADGDGDDLWFEDGSSWNGSIEDLSKASDLDREWQKRRDQFHTIGYRDGLIAGKEAAAQEGFNIGFRESVNAGFNWGLVRGVTSAMACLPDDLKVRLVETQEMRNKFQSLYESAHSLSTADALKLFYEDFQKLPKKSEDAEPSPDKADLEDQSPDGSLLRNCYGQLQSLLECPAIKVCLEINQ